MRKTIELYKTTHLSTFIYIYIKEAFNIYIYSLIKLQNTQKNTDTVICDIVFYLNNISFCLVRHYEYNLASHGYSCRFEQSKNVQL